MIVIASIVAVGSGITALITWAVRSSRRDDRKELERLSNLSRRLEKALVGLGLDAVWYPDSRTVAVPRAKHAGQIQIFVKATGSTCTGCGTRNPVELHYVVAGSACGAQLLFVGDCCQACGRFVAKPSKDGGRKSLEARPEAWLKIFSETVHLEDLLEHLERGAASQDTKDLERRELELEGELNDIRLRLQGLRASRGELSGGPFRPQLVAGGKDA